MKFDNLNLKLEDIPSGPFACLLGNLLIIYFIVLELNIILSYILKQKKRGR